MTETGATPRGWVLIQSMLQHRREQLVDTINSEGLQLDLLEACIKVYKVRGERHPSECGASRSIKDLQDSLANCTQRLIEVDEAIQLMGNVVRPQEADKTPAAPAESWRNNPML